MLQLWDAELHKDKLPTVFDALVKISSISAASNAAQPAHTDLNPEAPEFKRQESSTPSVLEGRWWLQVGVGEYRMRAQYDSGASCTMMGQIALQLATQLGRPIETGPGQANLANGGTTTLVGYVTLPLCAGGTTKEIRVGIMPELDTDC